MPYGKAPRPELVELAAALREHMHRAKTSIPALAEKMGVSHASVWSWMQGKNRPNKESMAKLAEAFGVSADSLISSAATRQLPVAHEPRAVSARNAGDMLSFSVTHDGQTRIRMDVTLPLDRGSALIRMLLDHGVTGGQDVGEIA